MLGMDRVYVIRHKWNDEGLSIRQIARDLGVSRNTVRKYVGDGGEPRRRASPQRPRPVLDGVRERIDEILQEWSARTTGKQRITGTLVHTQLLREGYRVGCTTVRAYLAEKRRQRQEVYLPLIWRPGEAAQVDFFDVTVEVAGERRKAWLFVVHLMYSRRDFAWLYERCNQIAFLDGHVRAFEHLGDAVIQQHLKTLKLPAVRREYGQLARQARADSWSYEEYLRELLDIEIRAREASTTARRLREARFPDLKTLGQIDWDAMAGVSKQQILELASCQFIERPEDVVIAGPIGTGKSHLAIALGVEAAKRRFRVLFVKAADLVRQLLEARDDRELGRLQTFARREEVALVLTGERYVPSRSGASSMWTSACRKKPKDLSRLRRGLRRSALTGARQPSAPSNAGAVKPQRCSG